MHRFKGFFGPLLAPEVRFYAFFGAAVFIVAIFGIYWHSPEWIEEIYKKNGSTAGNLIAEFIGIVISLIIIAPLTAHYVDIRRRKDLEPAIRTLLHAIGDKIENVASTFKFWNTFVNLRVDLVAGSSVLVMNQANQKAALELIDFVESLSSLEAIIAKVDERKDRYFSESNLRPELVSAAKLLSAELRHHMKKMWFDIASLEKSIEIIIPLLPLEAVANASKISSVISKYNSDLYDIDLAINGLSLQTNHYAASRAVLDFDEIVSNFRKMEAICGASIKHDLKNSIENRSMFTSSKQAEVNKKIYFISEIIERSDDYDLSKLLNKK